MNGLMEGSMKGNGSTIICMGKEFILGKMVVDMKVLYIKGNKKSN